jgi:hypothetical protein
MGQGRSGQILEAGAPVVVLAERWVEQFRTAADTAARDSLLGKAPALLLGVVAASRPAACPTSGSWAPSFARLTCEN